MMGGGDCGGTDLQTTLENCYQRSKTVYGSSIYWAETRPWGGILSTNASLNPFATWTKVFMIYCDGAFHQGNTKEPFSYKDTDLYFRGGLNTRAHFQYIHNRFNLTNADNVILSGSSAGGISTFIWVDYLKSFVGNSRVKIHSIIDSGIFLDQSQII
jgi:O-palmitoleoyl-L-serine hydrolase